MSEDINLIRKFLSLDKNQETEEFIKLNLGKDSIESVEIQKHQVSVNYSTFKNRLRKEDIKRVEIYLDMKWTSLDPFNSNGLTLTFTK